MAAPHHLHQHRPEENHETGRVWERGVEHNDHDHKGGKLHQSGLGRAGRDGGISETLLFYTYADFATLKGFVDTSNASRDFKEVQLSKLNRIQQFCEATTCRRNMILSYFGEHRTDTCGTCDNCKNPPKGFDGTILAQKALSAIKRVNQRVSMPILIDILRGSRAKHIVEKGYHTIRTYGAGGDLSTFLWQQYIMQLVHHGLIEIVYHEGNRLILTSKANSVLFDGQKVNLVSIEERIPGVAAKPKQKTKSEEYEEGLFDNLRAVRKKIAQEEGVPPYIIFSDQTLKQMATERPVFEHEMLEISGVGEYKYDQYGQQFIYAIKKFINDQQSNGQKIKGSTYVVTQELFEQGLSPEEIAEKRNLNIVTIFSHLIHMYEKGAAIDLNQFISKKTFSKVEEAVLETNEREKAKVIFEHLEGSIEYQYIRIGLALLKKSMN